MNGTLYLVAVPSGNPDELTLRGRRILNEVETVYTDALGGSDLIAGFGPVRGLVELNRQTPVEVRSEFVARLREGWNIALVSDFVSNEPKGQGMDLVAQAVASGIPVVPVPGPSEMTAALVVSGLPGNRFRFLGTLPEKADLRLRAVREWKDLTDTLVLVDSSGLGLSLLRILKREWGAERQAAVACDLFTSREMIERGSLGELVSRFERRNHLKESVLVLQGHLRHTLQRS